MYPVSDEFRTAVTASNQLAISQACVVAGDDVLGWLDIVSGNVDCDGTRNGPLRSLALTVAPNPDAFDWLVTAGAEVKVWRGLTLSQTTELVPLGVFVLDSDLEEDESGQIAVGGSDRAQRISRARWVDPYTVPAGTNVATAISGVLATCWPGCPIGPSFAAVTKLTGAAQTYLDGSDSDPWSDARNLASSAGYDLYFDCEGTAQLRESPDPATAMPCFSYFAGDDAVVLTSLRTALITQMYNGVIATAEGSGVGVPKRGEAWDDDPTSPTYRYGAMGQVPRFFSSPLLTTQDDVDSAAATILARVKGRLEQRTLTIIVNPALEAFDAIELTAADGTVARYFIDSLTTPLEGATAMTLTTRATPVT